MLVEILHRLPYKQASICKSVSKRWNSLISGPQFQRQFISRWQYLFQQHDQHCSFVANPTHLLLIPNLPPKSLDLLGPNLETSLSFLNSLPSLPDKKLQSHQVLGYSNNLLLFNIYHLYRNDYDNDYVSCNVFDMIAKQLIELPPRPPLRGRLAFLNVGHRCFKGGLVCDRNYYMETAERAAATKFFVVFAQSDLCDSHHENELQIYSSETGQWRSLFANYRTGRLVSAGVPHHGVLYFLGSHDGLIVCDPILFTCHFIGFPNDVYGEIEHNGKKYDHEQRIGVCCGTLRLCLTTYLGNGNVNLMVWELRGFDKGTGLGFWHLVHDVCPGSDIWTNSSAFLGLRRRYREFLPEFFPVKNLQIKPLALHPYNRDIL